MKSKCVVWCQGASEQRRSLPTSLSVSLPTEFGRFGRHFAILRVFCHKEVMNYKKCGQNSVRTVRHGLLEAEIVFLSHLPDRAAFPAISVN
jgi:hypothetical protein